MVSCPVRANVSSVPQTTALILAKDIRLSPNPLSRFVGLEKRPFKMWRFSRVKIACCFRSGKGKCIISYIVTHALYIASAAVTACWNRLSASCRDHVFPLFLSPHFYQKLCWVAEHSVSRHTLQRHDLAMVKEVFAIYWFTSDSPEHIKLQNNTCQTCSVNMASRYIHCHGVREY